MNKREIKRAQGDYFYFSLAALHIKMSTKIKTRGEEGTREGEESVYVETESCINNSWFILLGKKWLILGEDVRGEAEEKAGYYFKAVILSQVSPSQKKCSQARQPSRTGEFGRGYGK